MNGKAGNEEPGTSSALNGGEGSFLPVESSILSTGALEEQVGRRYGLPRPDCCELVASGENDMYRLHSGVRNLYLRVYRHGTPEAFVREELLVLAHLAREGLRVPLPLTASTGDPLLYLAAPEGSRIAVLYRTLEDGRLDLSDSRQVSSYGRAVGALHDALDRLPLQVKRLQLDGEFLVARPMMRIRPYLPPWPDENRFIESLATSVLSGLRLAGRERPSSGLCHGDLNLSNVLWDGRSIGFLDFELCGHGWRAYDLAVFLWNLCDGQPDPVNRTETWETYLSGYRESRGNLADADCRLLPLLVIARHFETMGYHALCARKFGSSYLDENYFKTHLAYLHNWQQEYGIAIE